MNRSIIRRIVIATLLAAMAVGVFVLASPGDAVLSILVRDPVHPCAPYQSTKHSFYVQIFHCDGAPLIWKGVNYGIPVQMTLPGPKGGRIQIDVAVPSGCYIVRALAKCKNVVSDWAYVEACCGNTVCVNLVLPTVKHCIQRMVTALHWGTLDPEGQEDRLLDVYPREVEEATGMLLRIADLLPKDSLEFPRAPDADLVGKLDEPEPSPEKSEECCGGVYIDLSALPFPVGPLPAFFVYDFLTFTEVYEDIEFSGSSLNCFGSEFVGGVWHDATVRINLLGLSCVACAVSAEVDGHGPDARLLGHLADGTIVTDGCPGDRRVLKITGSLSNPIVAIELSGQEAEWFWIQVD